ncbi:MAG: Ig-like domain-containing protein [Bryobacteraceae bacterium]|nr:Ig-like domain-containing protein [Bryobacteraceae bacterium]
MQFKRFGISAATICLLTQAAIAQNVFLTPLDAASTQLSSINGEPFSFSATFNSVTATYSVLQTADPQKFYAIGTGSIDNVGVLTGRFPGLGLTRRIAVGTAVTGADVSPDGRRLLLAGPNGLAIVDAGNDSVLAAAGSIAVGATPIDVVSSIDSRYAFVLSPASRQLTSVNLANNAILRTLEIPVSATSVRVAPTGLVYVTATSIVYEIDPETLAIRSNIPVSGTPQALQFTPSGQFALARNSGSQTGFGISVIDVANRRSVDTSGTTPLNRFTIVDDTLGYGVTSTGGLAEIRIASNGVLSLLQPTLTGIIPSSITDVAASGEVPRSRFVFVSSGNQVYRINTATSEISAGSSAGYSGNLISLVPPSNNVVAGLIGYNTNQTVPGGSVSLPLIALAYDANGAPSIGANVSFSTAAVEVVLSNPTTTTNFSGFASTTVTVPANRTGAFPVTAQVGGRSLTFTITIGAPGTGGPGGTQSQFQVISGQGQVLVAAFGSTDFQEPLRVRYTDTSGRPIPGAQIAWSLIEGQGAQGTLRVLNGGLTNDNGVSEANITAGFLPGANTPIGGYTIRALAPNNQEQIIYVRFVRRQGDIGGVQVAPNVTPGATITARSGETVVNALSFSVRSLLDGVAIQFAGLRVDPVNTDPALGPVAECRNGPTVLADVTGNVSCDLVVRGRPGTTQLRVNVGAGASIYNYLLTVTVGSASAIQIVSGNNQSAAPGTQLNPFVIDVTDEAGNRLSGVAVNWVFPPTAGIIGFQSTTDVNGRATATISLPTAPGTYSVRAVAGSASATFTATTAVSTTSLSLVSGDAQSATISQPFQLPLVVQARGANNAGLAGVPVSFTITGGTLNATSVTTDASGNASVSVTAGNTAGPVVVTAASGTFRVTFNLTANPVAPPPPVFTAANVLNAASLQAGISPGSIAVIRLSGIAPALRGTVTGTNIVGPLPVTLNGVQVQVGGLTAPIYSVSNVNGEESVVIQVPFEVTPGTTTVTVQAPGAAPVTAVDIPILAVKPGVFTYLDAISNSVYAVATRPDGSYVSSSNPARRGEVVRIYASGLGQTTPATATNRTGVAGQRVASSLIVGVNNAGARLVSAELLPGATGLYVVALEIPADTATGPAQPIGLAAIRPDGGAEFSNGTALPIQ